ncbi:MAG TPA: hypothetical protein VF190_08725 [Rhodothermales bacterium]
MNSEWAQDRIEAYVDGDLNRDERRTFESVLRADPALTESVRQARRIRTALHAMLTPECPAEVTEAIVRRVRSDGAAKRSVISLFPDWSTSWRPALVVTAALAVSLLVWRPWQQPPPPPEQYAAEDVELALQEVKWTLAYLNDIGSRTGETIRDEVIAERVVDPIERSLGILPESESPR